MFEFCCSKDSNLGKVSTERNIDHVRLSQDSSNMADNHEVNDLLRILDQFPGAVLWGSIPCGPWSTWQNVNSAIHGKGYEWKLKQKRKHSMKILRNFLRCAKRVIQNGGLFGLGNS